MKSDRCEEATPHRSTARRWIAAMLVVSGCATGASAQQSGTPQNPIVIKFSHVVAADTNKGK